jgi:type IV secretion system protein VirB11
MNQLVKSTMRMRPDRIIVGEVRDGAALSLLKAWNTGHPGGVATIHANSAYDGLIRLEQLVSEVSQTPMQQLIAASVDVLVFIERSAGKRRVAEIIEVSSFSANQYQTHSLRPSSQKEITHAT